eukprot:7368975-Prymnesium_polylepis.1
MGSRGSVGWRGWVSGGSTPLSHLPRAGGSSPGGQGRQGPRGWGGGVHPAAPPPRAVRRPVDEGGGAEEQGGGSVRAEGGWGLLAPSDDPSTRVEGR